MSKKRVWLGTGLGLALMLLLAACGESPALTATPAPSIPVAPTATPEPVPTILPTLSPTATATPPPTVTPIPTVTPTPAPTPTAPPANDGRWLAYISREGTLYTARVDNSRKTKVAENVQTIEWSPDGTRFIFYKRGENLTNIASYDGSNSRQLTTIGGYGKWLPGGKGILLRPATAASRKYAIISEVDGTQTDGFELPDNPEFSETVFDLTPDGKNVVYYRLPQEGSGPPNQPTRTPSNRPTENPGQGLRLAEYRIHDLVKDEDRLLGANLSENLTVWNADYSEIISPDLKDGTIKAISLKTAQARVLARYTSQSLVLLKRDITGKRLFWMNPLTIVNTDASNNRAFTNAQTYYPSTSVPSYYLAIAPDGNTLIYAAVGYKDANGREIVGGVFRVDVTVGRSTKLADNDLNNPTAEVFAGASYDTRYIIYTVRTANTGNYIVRDSTSGKEIIRLDGLPYWQPTNK